MRVTDRINSRSSLQPARIRVVSLKMKNSIRGIVNELHSPARKNFPRRRVIVKSIRELFQSDLIDMSKYSRQNKGFKFLLVVINVFTKFAWVQPLKSKSGNDVTLAMEKILQSIPYKPKFLHSDEGKEYFNAKFKALMDKFNIIHYATHSVMKASIVERLNRTIKMKIWKHFSLSGKYEYIDVLQKLVDEYNSSKHRTTGMAPKNVGKKDEKYLLNHVYNNEAIARKKPKFKKGDVVRVSKYKHLFEKGYTPNWSAELFKIVKVNPAYPTTYKLEDYTGEPILGSFYEMELLKTKYPNDYLIEKILKTDKNKIFVKWLGHDPSHNSWIKKE